MLSRLLKVQSRIVAPIRLVRHASSAIKPYKADDKPDPFLPFKSQLNALLHGRDRPLIIDMDMFYEYTYYELQEFANKYGVDMKMSQTRRSTNLIFLPKPNPKDRKNTDGQQEKLRPSKVLDQPISFVFPPQTISHIQGELNKVNDLMTRFGHGVLQQSERNALKQDQVRNPFEGQNTFRAGRPLLKSLQPLPPQKMMEARARLPMSKLKDKVLKLIRENQVTVVTGATGSGKSTQLPQYILDEVDSSTRIMVVQPRRISAISLAQRVSDERGTPLGQIVGYQVRNDSKFDSNTRILFVTTGILVRRFSVDPLLSGFSHIIMDEVHERSLDSDFCLAILKRVLTERKSLNLVAMSATFNSDKFASYLTLNPSKPSPHYDVPGISYPIEVTPLEHILEGTKKLITPELLNPPVRPGAPRQYRESTYSRDWFKLTQEDKLGLAATSAQRYHNLSRNATDSLALLSLIFGKNRKVGVKLGLLQWEVDLIIDVLKSIQRNITKGKSPPGAVLVFLPGWDDITLVSSIIEADPSMPSASYHILPLHSSISPEEQRRVFDPPEQGKLKVVLTTNVAETGITISDAVYVIDTGKVKESDYDPISKISALAVKWITRANARQRMGRAGRVAPGYCFQLYPKEFFDEMPDFPTPEILRTSLDSTILQILLLQLNTGQGIRGFLDTFIDPPSGEAIEASIAALRTMGAIESNQERLTPLGRLLANLPLDPRDGNMLVRASLFDCVAPALTVVAAQTQELFYMPPAALREEKMEAQRELSVKTNSDIVATINGFHHAIKLPLHQQKPFCSRYFISSHSVRWITRVRQQLLINLHDAQMIPPTPENHLLSKDYPGLSEKDGQGLLRLQAALVSGLYPNFARVVIKAPGCKMRVPRLLFDHYREGNFALNTFVDPHRPTGPKEHGNDWAIFTSLFVNRDLVTATNLTPSLRGTTLVDHLTFILFCRGALTVKESDPKRGGQQTLQNLPNTVCPLKLETPNLHMVIHTNPDSAKLILDLRKALEQLLHLHLVPSFSKYGLVNLTSEQLNELHKVRSDFFTALFSCLANHPFKDLEVINVPVQPQSKTKTKYTSQSKQKLRRSYNSGKNLF